MRQILIFIIVFASIDSYSQTVIGEYFNEQNQITKLVINKDSTFSYYDWHSGSCWAQVNKSGFIQTEVDTLILISTGECMTCLNITFNNYSDTTKIAIEFDPLIQELFPDLKVSFDFELEKWFSLDNHNRIVSDLIIDKGTIIPFTVNFRSRDLNTDIYLDLYTENRTTHDNYILIQISDGFEEDFTRQQEIFAKYQILKTGNILRCDDPISLASKELIKK